MFDPIATYRFQFHSAFTFDDFEKIIPYLQKLGVSTVYASPVFQAAKGSTHGYDGLNPHQISPEIGTEEGLRTLSARLRTNGIGWLQDIVPNHMAFDPKNEWLMDVLEKGQQSPYAAFFDLTWNSPVFEGRLMVPFLGDSLEEVIRKGDLKVDREGQRFVFRYFEAAYPLAPASYATILAPEGEKPPQALLQLLEQMHGLKGTEDPAAYAQGWHEWLLQLEALCKNESTNKYILKRLEAVNGDQTLLEELAKGQVYRLCHWGETDNRINYRRFFTVNGLICLNIQEEGVFQTYHQLVKKLVDEGIFQGLRIDHVDGLYDPTQYLQQLRQTVGEEPYIVVEKILESHEQIPSHWPIQGNTGYDFLAVVNNLFTESASREAFTQYYYGLTGDQRTVPQQVRDSKAHILYQHMQGELENLYRLFCEQDLVEGNRLEALPEGHLKKAIGAFLIHCPVYRYYSNILPLAGEEAAAVQSVFEAVRQSEPELEAAVSLLEEAFIKKPAQGDPAYNLRAVHFFKRCMQFSGPLMAKGVEDTLMYTFNRFVAHNEVGDAVDAFGISAEDFHRRMKERQEKTPLSLNGTSTHDTKRGEDVRARLNVLTDLPEEWLRKVEEWRKLTAGLKKGDAPDPSDEYFIYQTLAGAYPMPGEGDDDFENRIGEYLQKALREAKRHSNWTTPNEAYEKGAKDFAAALLDKSGPFWKSFQPFHEKLALFGIINSLAQVVLKFTCPGVPDVYQGCELWDLSLVDPDNRRPVDYQKREAWLEEITGAEDEAALIKTLWEARVDGRIKLWLTHRLLRLRKAQPELFSQGDYIPLQVEGAHKNNILAFARRQRQKWVIVIVPLHVAALAEGKDGTVNWKDTRVLLPKGVFPEWTDLLLGRKGEIRKGIPVEEVLQELPFALLEFSGQDNERGAGILLHISSLPSPFGIGDLGPQAKAFARFLGRGHQKFWQLLPINPTEAGQGHSPYSSTSSRAGNILFISPELLAEEGWLSKEDLSGYHLPEGNQIDYTEAERVKRELLQKAWQNFQNVKDAATEEGFRAFCEKESQWLEDFALYMVLKEMNGGKPWYEWAEEEKLREPVAMEKLRTKKGEELEKQKWWQYLFDRQWRSLKGYCNGRGIQLIGDLPFYVSYDSADVWANRKLFYLNEKGERLGLAGVPPDSFSADGQLWGMPVYKWDVLKEENYSWWIDRLRKNIELFDLVRLDHFRAFADYWEVPAGEETARNGEWKEGPRAHFFESVKEQLGNVPFVAEDLGEINEPVLELRDAFHLPGMKILQFAFGEEMPASDYIPHNFSPNFLVYTGTHDNNTTRGWFRQEVDKTMRQRIEQYAGRPVSEEDIYWVLARMAYASVAKTAILPMQDLLNLDESARMNTPSSGENNWKWRLLPNQVSKDAENRLKEWTWLFNRR